MSAREILGDLDSQRALREQVILKIRGDLLDEPVLTLSQMVLETCEECQS